MSSDELVFRSMVLDEFLPLLGRDFAVDASPEEIAITLTEAYPLRANAYADRPPFRLIFRSSADVILMTGSYALRAPGFGPDLIHLSQTNPPPRDTSGCNFYQATFN